MMPPLPTEILHHIIQLSLPAVSFGTYRQRYRILLAYSLVNSTWRALARKELYEELFARDPNRAAAALRVEGAWEMVKRVHLGGDGRFDSDDLDDLDLTPAKLPRSAQRLVVSNLRLDVVHLPSLAQLKVLHLRWIDLGYPGGPPYALRAPPSLPHFASLSTLSLLDPYLFPQTFPGWTHWLNSTQLPLLRRLSVGFTADGQEFGEDNDFDRALSVLAPQLTHFSLAQGESALGIKPDFPWAKFTALSSLALFRASGSRPPSFEPLFTASQAPSLCSALATAETRMPKISWTSPGSRKLSALSRTPSLRRHRAFESSSSSQWSVSTRRQTKHCTSVRTSLDRQWQLEKDHSSTAWDGRDRDELLDWERFFEPW